MFVFFQLEWKGLVLSFANPLLMVSGCSMAYIYQALENYSTYGFHCLNICIGVFCSVQHFEVRFSESACSDMFQML